MVLLVVALTLAASEATHAAADPGAPEARPASPRRELGGVSASVGFIFGPNALAGLSVALQALHPFVIELDGRQGVGWRHSTGALHLGLGWPLHRGRNAKGAGWTMELAGLIGGRLGMTHGYPAWGVTLRGRLRAVNYFESGLGVSLQVGSTLWNYSLNGGPRDNLNMDFDFGVGVAF